MEESVRTPFEVPSQYSPEPGDNHVKHCIRFHGLDSNWISPEYKAFHHDVRLQAFSVDTETFPLLADMLRIVEDRRSACFTVTWKTFQRLCLYASSETSVALGR